MKILVTDIFLRKTFDVLNILFRHYPKTDILLLTENTSFISRLKCSMFYSSSNVLLLRSGNHFENDLNKIALQFEKEDLVFVPIEEKTVLHFYKAIATKNIPKNIQYLLPEEAIFNLARNKESLNIFCQENNIPCPKYIAKKDLESVQFDFPIIIKPKEGSGAKGIIFADQPNQIPFGKINLEDYLIQERLPNPKAVEGGFYLCKDGKILSFYSHKRIRTFPENGGVTVFSEATYNEKIKAAGAKLISNLRWNGLLMIEFIWDEKDREYKLIEINPRLWGSILLSEKCGSNFLSNYVNSALGYPVKESAFSLSFIRWIFPYDLIYFIKNPTNPFRFFAKNKKTCYINFSYTSFPKSLCFLLLSYFNFSKILQVFRK